jgi:hypothetical protein
MQQEIKTKSRKKFLLWGAAVLSSFTIFKFFSGRKEAPVQMDSDTVKMLTQDGKLVEIDREFLAGTGHKISNEELQQWIKK